AHARGQLGDELVAVRTEAEETDDLIGPEILGPLGLARRRQAEGRGDDLGRLDAFQRHLEGVHNAQAVEEPRLLARAAEAPPGAGSAGPLRRETTRSRASNSTCAIPPGNVRMATSMPRPPTTK